MLTLVCNSYKEGESIGLKHVHSSTNGRNVSPGFSWLEIPISTKSFVLSIIDPHPVAHHWVHWIVIDIPFNVREISEGASRSSKMPKGARELMNSYGEQGYGGPAPPKGSGPHPYVATLYALNVEKLNIPLDASLRLFQKSIEGKVIAEMAVTGTYEVK